MSDPSSVAFVGSDIFAITTGGTLCNREILAHLRERGPVQMVHAPLRRWPFPDALGLAGLVANVRNFFVQFPRGAEVWIDHGCYRDLFAAVWLWRALWGIRIVLILHHLDLNVGQGWRRGWRSFVEKLMLRAADQVLATSHGTIAQAVALGVPSEACAVIPVSRRFEPATVRVPDRSKREPGTVTFLFVGTLEPRKGVADALAALAAYRGNASLRFRCAGTFDPGDGYFRELQSLAAALPRATVDFLGRISHEELEREFIKADAFLFPSHWEGYGIAVEEAFCYGLPVLAFAAGSVPEVFSPEAAEGWLVPLHDRIALAAAVQECVDDPAGRLRRGRAARLRAGELVQSFDWAAFLRETSRRLRLSN